MSMIVVTSSIQPEIDLEEVNYQGFLKDIYVQPIKEPKMRTKEKCRDVLESFGPIFKQTGSHGTSKSYRRCKLSS